MKSRKKQNKDTNAIIVLIVIYAGIPKWTVKTNLEETLEEFRHRKGSSSILKYNLVDIRKVEEAIERGTVIARMSVIEKLKTKEEVMKTVDKFVENLTKEKKQ